MEDVQDSFSLFVDDFMLRFSFLQQKLFPNMRIPRRSRNVKNYLN